MVSVSASSTKIEVTAASSGIGVSVSPSPVTASSTGGPGPTGLQGPPGVQQLSALTDVALTNLQSGDVLRYGTGSWENAAGGQLTDGGNF